MKNVEDVYRLSALQRALLAWPARLEHLVWSFREGLDEAALEAALRELVGRHPVLRTAIFSQGLAEPMQVVREKVEVGLERPEADLEAYLEAERRRGMALTSAPLVRLALLRGTAGTGTLVLGYHPVVLDATSAAGCVRELFTLYEALRAGSSPVLEQSRPFREHIKWLEQQDAQAAERYFTSRLRGQPRSVLPERSVAPAQPTWVVQQLPLSAASLGHVQALQRQHRLSLEVLLLAAWALLLRPEGGEAVSGLATSGRSALRGEAMLGRLAGVLPYRVTVPAGGPALRWLRALQGELQEATRYEHVSLPQVRQWLEVPEELPLFQSAVAVAQEEGALKALGKGLGFHGLTHVAESGPAPLTVTAVVGAQLTLRFLQDTRHFEPAAVARLAERLGRVLEALVAQPEQDVALLAGLAREQARESAPQGSGVEAGAGLSSTDLEAVLGQHPYVRRVQVAASGEAELVAHVRLERPGEWERVSRMRFGLFYFADEADGAGDKYRVYLEGAKFADRHGFTAVWTPERHFHAHGGLYPNPSVLSAALATVTERVSLRAGSVVLPLHHPLRLAEEWSMVDNLSRGRAAISITSGWVPNDFAFSPESFSRKREVMFQRLEELRRLWRGEPLPVVDGAGNPAEVHIFPRPVQPELPIWLTCAGGPELFVKGGELGLHILTSLLQQSLEDAAVKIASYRQARARNGHAPEAGTVSMMLHTYVGEDPEAVLEKVRGPLTAYLRAHVDLMQTMVKSLDMQVDINEPRWLDSLVSFAFERYYRTSALIGTPTACFAMLERLAASGVDEVACFIDFGVDADSVLAGLEHLADLKRMVEDEEHRVGRLLSAYLRERLPGLGRLVRFRLEEEPAA